MINKKISPIKDEYIEKYLKNKKLKLSATNNYEDAFKNAEYIIIATPTNYNEEQGCFDTSTVEDIIIKIKRLNINATTVIKSTIPIGFVDKIKNKYNLENLIFSPEFLREGKALYDNLYPSRIIVGGKSDKAFEFANLLKDSALKKDIQVLFMNSSEAEAVKLFSNAYLALRVSFFNEIDTYAEYNRLNTKDIIDGVCSDPRIGNYYNNPSFGYGGYCLPKDTNQLFTHYKNIPQNLIKAIICANNTRKRHIVKMILNMKPNVVGIYRLTMKTNSDNFKNSAILDIIESLNRQKIKVIIYEPYLGDKNPENWKVENNLKKFKKISDVIVANRYDDNLNDVMKKVYTRDIYNSN